VPVTYPICKPTAGKEGQPGSCALGHDQPKRSSATQQSHPSKLGLATLAVLTDLLTRLAESEETRSDTRHRQRRRSLVNETHGDTRDPEDVRRSAHNPATADSHCAGARTWLPPKPPLFRLCSVRAEKTVEDAHH
jgi:hypothetical protein